MSLNASNASGTACGCIFERPGAHDARPRDDTMPGRYGDNSGSLGLVASGGLAVPFLQQVRSELDDLRNAEDFGQS
jgi:hypothetical protein